MPSDIVNQNNWKSIRKRGDHAKKSSSASRSKPRTQIVPEAKELPGAKPKKGPKHIHRKDITLPPTVAMAAKEHADELGISDVNYYNQAVVSFFSKVLTGEHDLIEPMDACPRCGEKGGKAKTLTRPNAPPESGFTRVRVGVRFTSNITGMLEKLAEDWFGGTWSHAFEACVRNYLGKKNPPPEGKGRVPGIKLPKGRVKKGETAEDRVVRALAQARGEGS